MSTNTPPVQLSPREREVVDLLCADLTNAQIAERLSITKSTVNAHVEHAKEKLGLEGRHTRGAYWRAVMAERAGLLS